MSSQRSSRTVQAVRHRDERIGQEEAQEQTIEIMMDEHWRSVVHPDRVEGIKAYTEGREPARADPDF